MANGSVRISAEPGVFGGPSGKKAEEEPWIGGKGKGLSAELGWDGVEAEPEGGGIWRWRLGRSPFTRPGSVLIGRHTWLSACFMEQQVRVQRTSEPTLPGSSMRAAYCFHQWSAVPYLLCLVDALRCSIIFGLLLEDKNNNKVKQPKELETLTTYDLQWSYFESRKEGN